MGLLKRLVSGGVGELVDKAADTADRFHYSARERWQDQQAALNDQRNYELENRRLDAAGIAAQNEINLADAKSGSLFKGGWRPSAGWVCVAGLGYTFLFVPLFGWIVRLSAWAWGAAGDVPLPPAIDNNALMALLIPLLGLGAYRTYERRTGGIPKGT